MNNKHRGEVSFEADGKSYTLLYSADALCRLEDDLDLSIVAIAAEMQSWAKAPDRVRLGFIRSVFWAGLCERHPRLSIKEAGELLMKIGGAAGGMVLIGQGFERAFPTPEPKPETDGSPRPTKGRRANSGIGPVS